MEVKIYFMPGEMVTIKQDIPNKPIMLITEIVSIRPPSFTNNPILPKPIFKGIRCVWFTVTGELQEKIFSTKDLIKIEEGH